MTYNITYQINNGKLQTSSVQRRCFHLVVYIHLEEFLLRILGTVKRCWFFSLKANQRLSLFQSTFYDQTKAAWLWLCSIRAGSSSPNRNRSSQASWH